MYLSTNKYCSVKNVYARVFRSLGLLRSFTGYSKTTRLIAFSVVVVGSFPCAAPAARFSLTNIIVVDWKW